MGAGPEIETIAVRLGQRIRERRKQLGLTYAHASDRTGGRVKLSQWSSYERGVAPAFYVVPWIALALECLPEDLYPDDFREATTSRKKMTVATLDAAMRKRPRQQLVAVE